MKKPLHVVANSNRRVSKKKRISIRQRPSPVIKNNNREGPSLRIVGANTNISLSNRFAQIHSLPNPSSFRSKKSPPSKLPTSVKIAKQRMATAAATKKQANLMLKRQANLRNNPRNNRTKPSEMISRNKKSQQSHSLKKPVVVVSKKNAKGSKRNPKVRTSKQPQLTTKKKAENLDMDMDDYWFKAGKGPDPKQSVLDRQMDSYWAEKEAKKKTLSMKEGDL